LICSLGWFQTHDPPACASQVQGFQTWAITPSFIFGTYFFSLPHLSKMVLNRELHS
jgi:hypothetical protein